MAHPIVEAQRNNTYADNCYQVVVQTNRLSNKLGLVCKMHHINKAPDLPINIWTYLNHSLDARRILLRALQPRLTSTRHSIQFHELADLGVLEQRDIPSPSGNYEVVLTNDYSPSPSNNGKHVAALSDHLLYLAASGEDQRRVLNDHLESAVTLDGASGYLCTTNLRALFKSDSMLRHYRLLFSGSEGLLDHPTDDSECIEMKFIHPRYVKEIDGELITAGSPRLLDAIFRPEQHVRVDQIPYMETRENLLSYRMIPQFVANLPSNDNGG